MNELKVVIPPRLNVMQSLSFIKKLNGLPSAEKYIFDFRELFWSEPFGLLAVSYELSKFAWEHKQAKLIAENYASRTYEGHMGFFQAFGLDEGKKPGDVAGNFNYLPIKIKSIEALQQKARSSYEHVGEIIEQYAKEISDVLNQNSSEELKETLVYSIREIIRNAVEHSGATQFGYCAQHWPQKNIVEFSMMDKGIGIRKSLQQNPHLKMSCDKDALNLSLMPGVSGKTYMGKKIAKNDVWANSGFGLYMTSRICGNGGDFFIVSGGCGVLLNDQKRYYFNTAFEGTALRLRLNVKNIYTLNKMLSKFHNDGIEIAKAYGNGAVITASTASRTLAKEFN